MRNKHKYGDCDAENSSSQQLVLLALFTTDYFNTFDMPPKTATLNAYMCMAVQ